MHRMMVVAPPTSHAPVVTQFVVWLKGAAMWMGDGPNPRWVDRKEDAKHFASFSEAVLASESYDVVIMTVER